VRLLLLPVAAVALAACAAAPGPGSSSAETAASDSRLPCGFEAGLEAGLQALNGYAGPTAVSAGARPDRDEGDVAVLHDRGDLVIRRNPFDLDDAGVRFTPNAAGGYDVGRVSGPPGGPATALALGTGEARAVDLPFPFPVFGRSWTRAFVQSDGSVAFGTPDAGSGQAGIARFLSGPPRAAAFFAELDPSRGGGVSVEMLADSARILWSEVPGAAQTNRNTFELVLRAGGAVEMRWATRMQTREAVVGLSPGGTAAVTPADLSAGRPAGSAGALAERFSESEKADLVSVARRFLATHADAFEQLVVYTTRPLNPVPGTLAFEVNTSNAVRGIGLPDDLDQSAAWGSGGALASVVYMDSVDQYLEVDGFEILGHEVGHRWLTRAAFLDAAGRPSSALLGRGLSHWSFFFDSDASVLEGNRIEETSGGRFATVDIARGYCALDQYLMGLRAPEEVPPFFYVDEPDDFRPARAFKFSSGPEVGVSFTGTKREVRVEDVVAALGPRVPDARTAPHLLRHAFVLVADEVAPATRVRVQAVARIRSRFSPWYAEATEGRGAAGSALR
jgi:hypothetical protein